MPKKISERIVEAEELITEKKSAVTAIVEAASNEDRDLTDEEQVQVDEYAETIEAAQKSLDSLKRAEKALAVRDASMEQARRGASAPAAPRKEKPYDLLVKMAAVSAISFQTKQDPEAIARKMYADDARMEVLTRATVNPADSTTPGWAAELVGDSVQGFMEELRGESVYAQLAGIGLTLTFGNNGSITIPGWGGGPDDLAGSFISEGAPIPVKRSTLASQTLNRYKMAVISTFTKELSRMSTPQIEGLIRRKILADTAQALDTALLDGAAATAGVRPASIINGAATQATADGVTPDQNDILADLKFLMGTLTAANAGRAPVLIMHPSRVLGLSMITNATGQFVFRTDINAGNLMGARLVTSTYVPANTIILIDAADFATALGVPEFDVSDVATIVEGDDATVSPVSGATDSVRSLFQTWSTGLRMVMPLSWGMLRTNTTATITGAVY